MSDHNPSDIISSDKNASAYRVLARKYRPDNLDGLIGQDALVKTLQNAITHGRLAHAFVLTGVRGVGKTSTARILARGLNCIGADGQGGPTLNPCGQCDPCQAIASSRHVDVLEMDAASNTGVDDVRDIIDGAAYRPVSARFKIYIIDEVHMLSKSAFNALLKTLEEPPEAVKFIFATTEIRKVPVTILSRCQRFDLRRVSVEVLSAHLATITKAESIAADEEAIHMIARAAEGSVRDSLSLLDQAAAMNADKITSAGVSDMLGHAGDQDIGQILSACLSGDIQTALAAFEKADDRGADTETILSDLLDITHYASLAAAGAPVSDLPESTKGLTADLSKLGIAKLGRAWQILLKGHGEVKSAPNAKAAAQMLLIRLAHSAPMPTPAEILQKLPHASSGPASSNTSSSGPSSSNTSSVGSDSSSPAPSASSVPAAPQNASSQDAPSQPPSSQIGAPHEPQMSSSPAPSAMAMGNKMGNTMGSAMGSAMGEAQITPPQPATISAPAPQSEEKPEPKTDLSSIASIVALSEAAGEYILGAHMRNYVRIISLEAAHMEISLDEGAPDDLPSKMAKFLSTHSGQPFLVSLGTGKGASTLREQEEEAEAFAKAEAAKDPLVADILSTFPDAEVTLITALNHDKDKTPLAETGDEEMITDGEF